MKKIVVACGGAVATSTVAANRVRELCAEHSIPVDVFQARIGELDSYADTVDLIVTTAKIHKEYPVPVVHGLAFISGINVEATEARIIEALS
ncbi:MAG: PTS galactitol transporter subunit IIB [Dermabacter sp.]|nr:PTS galactitol transporter subunit IIB [Dermabacter sp.]